MRRNVNNGPHPDCANATITQSHITGRQFTAHFPLVITCLVFAANALARHKHACAQTLCALPRNGPVKSGMCGISFSRALQTRRLKSACSALSLGVRGLRLPLASPGMSRQSCSIPGSLMKRKKIAREIKQQKYKWEGGRLHAETQSDTSIVSPVKSERDETPDCSVAERYPFSRVQFNHLHVRVSNFIILSFLRSLTPHS